jgi:FlaA1/EpsC-like NDP-sugar epimerase
MLRRISNKTPGWLLLLVLDLLVLQIAFLLVFWIRYKSNLFAVSVDSTSVGLASYLIPDVVLTACWLGLFALFRFYRREPGKWLFEEVTRVISATSLGMLILVLLLVDFRDPLAEMKYSVFIYWGVILLLLVGNRIYYFRYVQVGKRLSQEEHHRMVATQKRIFLIFLDLVVIVLSYCGAFLLRFGGVIPRTEMSLMTNTLFVVLVVRFAMFAYFKVYAGLYRYASINDLLQIIKAVTAGSVLLLIPVYFFKIPLFPRSVFVLEWLLLVFLAGGLRFGLRTAREIMPTILRPGKRTLIVGAGDAGEMIVREMRSSSELNYQPVGFIDDDPAKRGMRIHGIPVLGDQTELEKIVVKKHISEIIIAIPSASSDQMRRIIQRCRNAKVSFKASPPLKDILDGKVSINQVREISVDDLLGRDPVKLDEGIIKKFIAGRRVMITGAAGSIGSEICRQTCRFGPEAVVMVERAENNLYRLDIELSDKYPDVNKVAIVADVCDSGKIYSLMSEYRPEVVFHAAAYKQVPLMEYFPEEAVKNNIGGTRTVAETSIGHRVSAFVMISTDKAVRPTSVMGATKRISEMVVNALAVESDTKMVTVRFGNVLGSDGSVVELFTRQIERGGPVTVTDPRVTRYFMTIREATLLVMMAGAIGANGQIMVLRMGEQVKILELAKDMITLAGFVPNEDIAIEYIGLRPGEKLQEELFDQGEGNLPSKHPQIMIAKTSGTHEQILDGIDELNELAVGARKEDIVAKIQQIVPSFTPKREMMKS